MKAFTWLSAYHLQGKELWNTSISSIKQRKGSTIQKSNKRGCMFSQHWGPLAAADGCHCHGVPFNRQEASVLPTNAGQVLKE